MLVFINYWIEKCTVEHWNTSFLFERQVTQTPIVISGVFRYKLTDVSKKLAASVFWKTKATDSYGTSGLCCSPSQKKAFFIVIAIGISNLAVIFFNNAPCRNTSSYYLTRASMFAGCHGNQVSHFPFFFIQCCSLRPRKQTQGRGLPTIRRV